jgi:hypothetical protein
VEQNREIKFLKSINEIPSLPLISLSHLKGGINGTFNFLFNPYKRKRLPVDFDELFNELIANLKEGDERPEEIIAEVEEEEV